MGFGRERATFIFFLPEKSPSERKTEMREREKKSAFSPHSFFFPTLSYNQAGITSLLFSYYANVWIAKERPPAGERKEEKRRRERERGEGSRLIQSTLFSPSVFPPFFHRDPFITAQKKREGKRWFVERESRGTLFNSCNRGLCTLVEYIRSSGR